MQPRLASKLQLYLSLPNAGIIGMYHHTWLLLLDDPLQCSEDGEVGQGVAFNVFGRR
jgi:hypothetical protein